MRIYHLYPFYHQLGGVEKYLLDTIPIQKQSGHEIFLIGGEFDDQVTLNFEHSKIFFIKRPLFLVAITFAISAQIFLARLLNLSRGKRYITHAQGASCFSSDVVTAHSCHKAWFFLSLKATKTLSVPWLKKILNPIHYLTIFIESIQYRPNGKAHIIAISDAVKGELTRFFGLPADRITVIHSGVDLSRYSMSARDERRLRIRRLHGFSDSDLVMIFVANEFRRKGLKTIIEAMSEIESPDVKLLVVGRDNPAEFQSAAAARGISGRVVFAGPTPDVADYYAASDIFVFPTLYEPFGLVITEALACGLPVITSKLAGAAELLTSGEDSILLENPIDPKELRDAITRLINPLTRERVTKAGLMTASKHSVEQVVRRIDHVYELVSKSKYDAGLSN